jgi:hypothetical protein
MATFTVTVDQAWRSNGRRFSNCISRTTTYDTGAQRVSCTLPSAYSQNTYHIAKNENTIPQSPPRSISPNSHMKFNPSLIIINIPPPLLHIYIPNASSSHTTSPAPNDTAPPSPAVPAPWYASTHGLARHRGTACRKSDLARPWCANRSARGLGRGPRG